MLKPRSTYRKHWAQGQWTEQNLCPVPRNSTCLERVQVSY